MAWIDRLIEKVPAELHLPGYSYCGPNTRLKERLRRGDRGINPLDRKCLDHDIAYAQTKDPEKRLQADRVLIDFAKKRIRAKDANISEKIASGLVSSLLTVKRYAGMGMKRKRSKQVRRRVGGFLTPAVLAGIGAASQILQTGSNLYRNYKLSKQRKRTVGEGVRRRKKRAHKRGSGLKKRKHRRRRSKLGAAYSLRTPQRKKR